MKALLGMSTSWSSFFTELENNGEGVSWTGGTGGWLESLLSVLSDVLWVGLAIAGAAGAIYAIWIGIKMAKAESSDEREEAKKHLINVIIAIVCVIALVVVFNVLLPMILSVTVI